MRTTIYSENNRWRVDLRATDEGIEFSLAEYRGGERRGCNPGLVDPAEIPPAFWAQRERGAIAYSERLPCFHVACDGIYALIRPYTGGPFVLPPATPATEI